MRIIIWAPLLWLGCRAELKTPTIDTDETVTSESDLDGDGYLEGDDCDDSDASIYPGAVETCDGLDNNCDGVVDEGVSSTFYFDNDADGFGNPEAPIEACDAPEGTVPTGTDCDDDQPTVYPSAEEVCDELDNDCNGDVDEDIPSEWYFDGDNDGYGDPEQVSLDCNPGVGYVSQSGDCDDSNAAAYPMAEEVCDEIDNNCDELIDEGVLNIYYLDADLDGFGDSTTVEACEISEGLTTQGGDCDDAASQINPDAEEVCGDNLDNNCDGVSDEATAIDATTWYPDNDEDGQGLNNGSQVACDQPNGYVSTMGDCDDTNSQIYTGAPELCDGITNECATPSLPTNEQDDDGDGYVECTVESSGWMGSSNVIGGDDCDDTNADHHELLTWYFDGDGDNVGISGGSFTVCVPPPIGYVLQDGDCDDSIATIYPSAPEICDGITNDCATGSLPSNEQDDDGDGYVECAIDSSGWTGSSTVVGGNDCDDTNADHYAELDWKFDNDGDGYGDPSSSFITCVPPPNGYVLDDSDCDDANNVSFPNATEICDGQLNNCNNSSIPSDELDSDGDGYVECTIDLTTWNGTFGIIGGDDCDDTDGSIYPNAPEVCSGLDLNCDSIEPPACSSCLEIKQVGSDSIGTGVYTIDTTHDGIIDAYCEMDTDGGGWTLVQRTVWDFAQSSQLITTFSTFYNNTQGSPESGNAYRMEAPLWSELNVDLDHMLKHVPRDGVDGSDCGPQFYVGNNGSFSLTSSSLSVSNFSSTVNFFSDQSFEALNMGSNCTGIYNAVPWFYTTCCATCPTFAGQYYSPARPMASYIDTAPDYFGNTSADTCSNGYAVSSYAYEAINSMEYFLR